MQVIRGRRGKRRNNNLKTKKFAPRERKEFKMERRTEMEKRKGRCSTRIPRVENKEWEDNEVELVNFGSEMGRVWKME